MVSGAWLSPLQSSCYAWEIYQHLAISEQKDKSKFGFKMLQKMGWSEGKGLGANEDGQRDHVKVRLKEDNMGVGADRRTVDNWLDNNSAFDALLKGLNSGEAKEESQNDAKREQTEEEKKPKKEESPVPAVHGRLYHRKKFLRRREITTTKQLTIHYPVHQDGKQSNQKGPKSSFPKSVHRCKQVRKKVFPHEKVLRFLCCFQ